MYTKITRSSELVAYLRLSNSISTIPKLKAFYPYDNRLVCIELKDVV